MAWEDKIIGYRIRNFDREDIIPVDAIYLETVRGSRANFLTNYNYEYFVFKIPDKKLPD